MTHAADEVAVRCGDAAFARCQNAHIAAEARTACRGRNNSARIDKCRHVAALHAFAVDRLVPGMMMQRMPSAIFLPFKMLYAASMSSISPFVQLPMTTWSTLISCSSLAGCVFSGRCRTGDGRHNLCEIDIDNLFVFRVGGLLRIQPARVRFCPVNRQA